MRQLILREFSPELRKALKLLKKRKGKVLPVFSTLRRHMADSGPLSFAYGIRMSSRWEYLTVKDKKILEEAGWSQAVYDEFSRLWETNDRLISRQEVEKFVKEYLEQ